MCCGVGDATICGCHSFVFSEGSGPCTVGVYCCAASVECTTKMLAHVLHPMSMGDSIHDTCINSATWNAAIRACNSLAPVWLILLRQFVIHKQPSASQDSCVACHASTCITTQTHTHPLQNSHLSACSLTHPALCTCLKRSLLLHNSQHALHLVFAHVFVSWLSLIWLKPAHHVHKTTTCC